MARDYVSTLLVSKGHPFAHDAFLDMFEAIDEIEVTLVQQPAAQVVLHPEHLQDFDAVLFYDMSGIAGHGMREDAPGGDGQPPPNYIASIEALLERGVGIVMLNHGTISWPTWPLWREISGTSFMLTAGQLNGEPAPGSGYRGGAHGPLPNATTMLTPASPGHPVLESLEAGFSITDELYLKTAGFESDVVPLLRSDFDFVAENFTAPPLASPDEQASWSHPPGSNLVAWAKACRNAPVVASDLGDGPAAFANSQFRTLIHNALRWVASADARSWAKGTTP
jgi:type 1 glutamine amidotransferase